MELKDKIRKTVETLQMSGANSPLDIAGIIIDRYWHDHPRIGDDKTKRKIASYLDGYKINIPDHIIDEIVKTIREAKEEERRFAS